MRALRLPSRGCAPRMRGMALVEALAALLIVTLGLISLAGLMLKGLQNDHAAQLRTQAVNIVADMLERIRANPMAGAAYACSTHGGGASERGCAATVSSAGRNCTAAELAEDDLARWQTTARIALPLTDDVCAANVMYAGAGAHGEPARYEVSVSWNERGGAATSTARSEILITPWGAP